MTAHDLMCRKHEEDIGDTHAETKHINQVIIEKDTEMAELKRQVAQGRPPIAGASSSAKGGASSLQQSDNKAGADDDSPKSNMSSPWGTDVSLPSSASLRIHIKVACMALTGVSRKGVHVAVLRLPGPKQSWTKPARAMGKIYLYFSCMKG